MDKIACSGIIVGDILLHRRINMSIKSIKDIAECFENHDFVIGNFEGTVYSPLASPALFPGGGYVATPARCVSDLQKLHFDAFNLANNHAMDYGETGLLTTINTFDQYDLSISGAGLNLAMAAAPCFIEGRCGRMAMFGITSSFHDSYAAGPQNSEFHGRAGVNPLKHNALYTLPDDDFLQLMRIGDAMGINFYHNQARQEGYLKTSDTALFGPYKIKTGEDYCVTTEPDEVDAKRLLRNVKDASKQAEIVVVNIHGHQFAGNDKDNPPQFIEVISRQCIDNGATFVICTGPHVIRGIEIYKNGVIFYGLGNFIFQHEQQLKLPEEFYNKYGLTREQCSGVAEVMNHRSSNGKKGLFKQDKVWESFVVEFIWKPESIILNLIPISINRNGNNALIGLPEIIKDSSVITRLKELSGHYNTQIDIDEAGIGHLTIKSKPQIGE